MAHATPTTTQRHGDLDEVQQAQHAILRAFLVTVHHFFGSFQRLFGNIDDPRDPARITYPLPALLFTGVLMFLCRLGARRQIGHLFRHNGPSAAKFQALFGVADCPHGDTLNAVFQRLEVEQVQALIVDMVRTLIRKKVLSPFRLLGRYYVIAVDGTGRFVFPERHCPHCLTATHNGRTIYYHPVLEAKLVLSNGLALSIMTEFIENPGEHPSKQDCELKAFYRLARRLKQAFPRLPICLSLDALFAGGPTLRLCEQYHWKYMIVHKGGDLPAIQEEFEALVALSPQNHLVFYTGPQSKTRQVYRWVNDITYVDSEKHLHTVSVLECLESKAEAEGQPQTTRFRWITNFKVKEQNVLPLAYQGGRIRWKIENEGFNVQKNGGYNLEHAYSRHPVASKVFYLLLQIAHLIAQLIEKGSLLRKAFPAGLGSAKNLAFRLLEAWRNLRVSAEHIQQMLDVRLQIRFRPP